jgi:hypothetical protein
MSSSSHESVVDLQAAGGIQYHHAVADATRFLQGVDGDRDRLFVLSRENGNVDLRAQHL